MPEKSLGRTSGARRPRARSTPSLHEAPAVLSVKDVLGYLPVGEMKVYELMAAGELRARRVGRRWFVTREALLQFLGETVK